jgi:carbon storage regulator
MMVMRRRTGESILIGEDIEIHITEIGRSRVKIAIDAPRHITITAKEVKVTREENLAALDVSAGDLPALANVIAARRPGPVSPESSNSRP